MVRVVKRQSAAKVPNGGGDKAGGGDGEPQWKEEEEEEEGEGALRRELALIKRRIADFEALAEARRTVAALEMRLYS